jgi:Domain of unknown function (DUF4328)
MQLKSINEFSKLTNWVKWVLHLRTIVGVVAVISGTFEYLLLNDFKRGIFATQALAIAAGEASDARQQLISIVHLILIVVCAILILTWIFNANKNVRQLGATQLRFSPGWAIGWYFVPFYSLIRPYQAMQEIWQASANSRKWVYEPIPSLLGVWWALFIAANISSNLAFRLSIGATQIDQLQTVSLISILSDIIHIPLNFVMVSLVGQIFEMQKMQFDNPAPNQELSVQAQNLTQTQPL